MEKELCMSSRACTQTPRVICGPSQYNEVFGMEVRGHQASVLNPLLFILVLEALSHQFRTGVSCFSMLMT